MAGCLHCNWWIGEENDKTCNNMQIIVTVTTVLSLRKPLWGSGGSLLTIARVRRLGSISWLRTISLGRSWSSCCSRGAFVSTSSISLARLAVVMSGGLGGSIASYGHMNVKMFKGVLD